MDIIFTRVHLDTCGAKILFLISLRANIFNSSIPAYSSLYRQSKAPEFSSQRSHSNGRNNNLQKNQTVLCNGSISNLFNIHSIEVFSNTQITKPCFRPQALSPIEFREVFFKENRMQGSGGTQDFIFNPSDEKVMY